MKINPTKVYQDAKIKYRVSLILAIICIISLFVIPFIYSYIPAILLLGIIYQAIRYNLRMRKFMFLLGITELETRIAFKWCDDDQIEKFEDIGFF